MRESAIHSMSRGLCRLLQTLLKQGRGLTDFITTFIPQNPLFRRILGPLAIAGTCYGLNSLLNRLVLNTRTGAHIWDWKKEIVLITGGSGGMGSHMVKQFARRNVQVVSFDIQPPKQALPANARFYQVDVTSPEAIHEAAEQIRRDIGDPTVLINNAGVVLGKDILSCSKDQVKRMFDVNILAHFWLSQEFLPSMIKQQHGHVVTMASIASFITIASNVDYSCTKAGLMAFHEGLAQDLKHRYNTRNVLTSIIYPYWVRTPLIKNLTAHPTFHDPLDEPDNVAEAIVNHVMGCKSGRVVLPAYGALLSGLRGFPFVVAGVDQGQQGKRSTRHYLLMHNFVYMTREINPLVRELGYGELRQSVLGSAVASASALLQ